MDFKFSLQEPAVEGLATLVTPYVKVQNNGNDVKYARKLEDWKSAPVSPGTQLQNKVTLLKRGVQFITTASEKIQAGVRAGYIAFDNRTTAENVVEPHIFSTLLSALDKIAVSVVSGGGRTGTASRVFNTVQEVQNNIPCSPDPTVKFKMVLPVGRATWPSHAWYINRKGLVNKHVMLFNMLINKLESTARQIDPLLQMPTTGVSSGDLCDRVAYISTAFLLAKLTGDVITAYRRNIKNLTNITVGKK